MSVTFTTHGHQIGSEMADELRGSVQFIRVSMDGVGDTYESIRRRSFGALQDQLRVIRGISDFGINIVVNDRTVPELDQAAAVAADNGATELLLLPQVATRTQEAITEPTVQALRRWVDRYSGPLKLCINETYADGFRACDPLVEERSLRAYAHVDAAGVIKPTSFHSSGVPIGLGRVLDALDQLAIDVAEKDA